jgi:ribonuclease HI
MWRLGHNSHPLLMNVERKGVETDTRCIVCKRLFEDGGHLFFNCKEVKRLWRALEMEDVRLHLADSGDPLRVIQNILALPEDRQRAVVALLWCWWSERNKENHKEKRRSTEELQFIVRQHATEWKGQVHTHESVAPATTQKWSPPSEDYVMLNCDGAYSLGTSAGGWGAVARDHDGDLIFAAAGHLSHVSQAMHAEAIAVKQALLLAEQKGIGRIIVASDCKNLIAAVTSNAYDNSSLGQLFLEIKYMLSLSFFQFRVEFCPRACNQVAHLLAAKGAGEGHGFHAMWDANYPDDVICLVASSSTEP